MEDMPGGVHGRQAPYMTAFTDVTEPAIRRAFEAPSNRDAVAGMARFLAEPSSIAIGSGSTRRNAVFLSDGHLSLRPVGRVTVKPAFVLTDRIGIADATVTVKQMVLPPSMLQAVEGMRIGDVVETGIPEVDAASIRIARQGGHTLALYMHAESRTSKMAVMLGLAGVCWPPLD